MTKVIIIDDEPLARGLVKEYLQPYADSGFEIVAECNDGFEGLKAIQQHQPDLIFLDIQMPKISGFEMLELIEGKKPSVIFTTAFDAYAMKAFDLHAADYLLKPFSEERFEKALQKWKNQQPGTTDALLNHADKNPEEQNRIVVKDGSQIKIFNVADILFLEAYDDYVKIHTTSGMYLKKKTLSYYESSLDKKMFVRVHRSFIMSLSQLTKIEPLEKNQYVAILKNGTRIPLSRNGYAELKTVLGL